MTIVGMSPSRIRIPNMTSIDQYTQKLERNTFFSLGTDGALSLSLLVFRSRCRHCRCLYTYDTEHEFHVDRNGTRIWSNAVDEIETEGQLPHPVNSSGSRNRRTRSLTAVQHHWGWLVRWRSRAAAEPIACWARTENCLSEADDEDWERTNIATGYLGISDR